MQEECGNCRLKRVLDKLPQRGNGKLTPKQRRRKAWMDKIFGPDKDKQETKMTVEQKLAQALAALEGIALLGGNLPDDRLTDKTGPNDAAYRGQMYCSAREIANQTIKKLKSE